MLNKRNEVLEVQDNHAPKNLGNPTTEQKDKKLYYEIRNQRSRDQIQEPDLRF